MNKLKELEVENEEEAEMTTKRTWLHYGFV